jgi:geranylgeranyl diphosphate synthase type I
MTQIDSILERWADLIEGEVRRTLASRPGLGIYQMMEYHLGWRDADFRETGHRAGKRLRPTLCLLTCEAVGGDPRQALPAAAAVELVHSFSLIHDDVADGDETRRGRATVWKRWGIGPAINAGDGMLTLSNLALLRLAEEGVAPALALQCCRVLNEACLTLCEGQDLDLSFEGRLDVTRQAYLDMIARKTAVLYSAPARLGALVGGAPSERVETYGRFGQELGLAFQIRDDILGIWGDPGELGKPVGGDLRRNKRSLPVIYGLEAARGAERERLAAVLRPGGLGEEEAAAVLEVLEGVGAQRFCQAMAEEHAAAGLRELAKTVSPKEAENQAQQELRGLAEFLVKRSI